ncbi:MAG TPA: FecR domain-containing protein [Thermoanaerobaculia bacterium]|nr:FecR domain-containing protein [Thermoanaerobaculia bacterium]
MSRPKNDDSLLDRAVDQIVHEPIDPAQVELAASRVWERLSQGAPAAAAPAMAAAAAAVAAEPVSLRGCDDFQSLIPAYVQGELSPARAMLLEDHARGCVPCRRALREAREGRTPEVRPAAAKASPRSRAVWLGLAAALVMALGVGLVFMFQEMLAGGSNMARIESIEGGLYLVDGETSRPLGAGDTLDEGEEIRTAKSSLAMVRMVDGSLIEMNERAALSLDAGRKGNTIHLDRGRIIVQAAKQRPRHLFVATRDALVSVTGTIFSVNHGTKGSRVSVIEGEVRVKQSSRDDILHPGNQVTTHVSVAAVPIRREIAWSKNSARYEQLLAELTALGRDIDSQVERPGLRYSTRLLDLAPQGTRIWVALPNLSTNLAETQRILDQRIAGNQVLRNWWRDSLGSSGNDAKFREVIERIGDLGRNLGEEVAVAIGADEPVFLAEVANEAAFRSVLEQEIARVNSRESRQVLRLVEDPAAAGAVGDGMLLWVGDGLFVASPSPAGLSRVAANLEGVEANPFVQSGFRNRIARSYEDGAGWLFAADLHSLMTEDDSAQDAEAEALGILDMESVIVDRREIEGKVETRAALTFDQPRRGVASWLAAPAPMGTLNFFSPDANLVAAFVVKNPVTIFDELMSIQPELADDLARVQAEHGFDLRNDLAAALGGEFAFGVDGPLVPSPSWKLVAEVYDPARLQRTFEQAAAKLSAELREQGKPAIEVREERRGGRTWYSLVGTDPKIEIHYLFEDGYIVAAPSRALLERTLQQRSSGTTLAGHARLRDLLGEDGQVNVSALLYQNLAPVLESAERLLPPGVRGEGHGGPDVRSLILGHGPMVGYAYAEQDRILFGSSSESPLGLNLQNLAGLGGILGMIDNAHGEAVQMEEAR